MNELIIESVVSPLGLGEKLERMIPMYKEAFAARPWLEISKCPADDKQPAHCPGGYSPVQVGECCNTCQLRPVEEAYTDDELLEKFTFQSADKFCLWYLEEEAASRGIALAVLARRMDLKSIGNEIYPDNPAVASWLEVNYGSLDNEIIWLEEVFANSSIRPTGNLKNFGSMCMRLARSMSVDTVAYRTINPKLISATKRDFRSQATISDPSFNEIPDRRKFVTIQVKN